MKSLEKTYMGYGIMVLIAMKKDFIIDSVDINTTSEAVKITRS